MKAFTVLLLFCSTFIYSQKPEAWLTKEAEENPEAYIQKAEKIVPTTPAEAAGRLFVLGRCYSYLNKEDIALKYYLLSKKEFEKLKLEEPAKDLSLEIHRVISSQENYDKYGKTFLDEYYAYALRTKSNDRLATSWNEFGKCAYDLYDFDNGINSSVLDSTSSLFLKALGFAKKTDNSTLKTKIYANLGTVENTRNNFSQARKYLDSAHVFALETKHDYDLFVNLYSYGNSYYIQGDYLKAIEWFKKAEKTDIPVFRAKTLRVLYKKLMESYDLVNDQENRRLYQNRYTKLDEDIKDREQNLAIHDINVKYQVAEKDREISSLQTFRDKFHKNRLIFGILLFLVFLLALYSFVRWKKLDFRKQELEVEKQQVVEEKIKIEQEHSITVQELEKVKNIVTEGYIILKDKSKVYLNDLMYIKSEDHYLHTYSSDDKKQFVRGKLSQILLELPPNFVKCHRSYIVNSNYIQAIHTGYIVLKNKVEIPVSRGFKL
jgi:tetratricopeptide (TPR) repeat protein